MNSTSCLERVLSRLVLSLIAGALVAGCASTPPVDWTGRIGNYTYDQAVAELGPPDRSDKLSDGSLVADWIRHSPSRMSVGASTGMRSYGNDYGTSTGVGVGAPVGSRQRTLQLKFGPDGKLADWSDKNQ